MGLLRKQNLERNTALHEAIRYDHYNIVELLIQKDPRLTSITNNAGESPLFLAVDRRFYKIALHIIDTPGDHLPSYKGRKRKNVLHAAVINRAKTDFVRKMLEKFPDASLEADDSGRIPLHYAVHIGNDNVDVVQLFLQRNNSIAYKKDNEGMCALHISVNEGHDGLMRTLIEKCPDTCELLDNKHRTVLHLAVESGRINAVKLFMETLAFHDLINEPDKDGNTPLHLAALHIAGFDEYYKILEILAHDRRIDKWARNEEGMTAADIIQSNNKLSMKFKKKIMGTCNLEGVDDGQTPKEVQTLENKGPSMATDDQENRVDDGKTPKEVQTLVNKGASMATDDQENRVDDDQTPKEVQTTENKGASMATDDQENISNFSLTSITIITTVTYAAAFQLPGGYDSNTGMPVLRNHSACWLFLFANSFSFLFSAVGMFIHYFKISKQRKKTRPTSEILLDFLTYFSICFMLFAYFASMWEIMIGCENQSVLIAPPPK
ncbi:ankyrin repeat-containing protein ITN1-like [Quercus lobata]|nr:ankyrin repeat-containing protein ITN1-like [Quercus lobata]